MPVAERIPKYRQLAEELRQRIVTGDLMPGDRLPSFADMYREQGVTATTMTRVYQELENQLLIERRGGSGVYVTQPRRPLTGMIGLAGMGLRRQEYNAFYPHILHGVLQVLDAHSQHWMYTGPEYALIENIAEKVDGVLICKIENAQQIVDQLPPHFPCVSLFNKAEGQTSVVADDFGGAMMAIDYLWQLGHRRIACLMEDSSSIVRQRINGYRQGLLEKAVVPEPEWQRLTPVVTNFDKGGAPNHMKQPYLNWAKKEMSEWLAKGWSDTGCTAILVQNDIAAIGVVQTLQKAGISVPEQVSVMSFDGTEMCDMIVPSLCAIELPLVQIGNTGMEILEEEIGGKKSREQVIVLPTKIRPGDSVAPPPQ